MNMFGITELKEKHSCRVAGFHVRLGWKNKKPAISAEFGNEDWGGRGEALKAAICYRDSELEKMKLAGTWPVDRSRAMDNLTARNTSGVNGVHKARQWGRRPGGKRGKLNCFAWVASWFTNGKIKTASFGETKWGASDAFQMACNCREARENIYTGAMP